MGVYFQCIKLQLYYLVECCVKMFLEDSLVGNLWQIYTGSLYVIDGCATFFRRDRFSLVKKYEVRYRSLDFTYSKDCRSYVTYSVRMIK
jgi:hypothetical protein